MAMNFFEHQDRARRNTTKLVVIYVAAVIGLILIIWFPLSLVVYSRSGPLVSAGGHVQIFLLVSLSVCIVIGLGSLFKTLALRAGGGAIAESLGGRLLQFGVSDPLEQRIVNVVEEMAIASGCPVPAVYLLDEEEGINAFAAGFSLDDAAIGITRGCAEELNRDELQGVVAHEFSHIINGDMKLNLRLIGILAGITLLSTMGYILFRVGGRASRTRQKEGGSAAAGFMLVGGVLYLGGCLGGLAAALIQAAISRQREFLADSSAVQFTRLPEGIGGALKKIGGYAKGSVIENPHVTETRHMFFSLALNAVFATHPPIDERIRRIDASWEEEIKHQVQTVSMESAAVGVSGFSAGVASPGPVEVPAASHITQHIGQPTAAHVAYARALRSHLPPGLLEAAHDAYSARAVIYALLLDKKDGGVQSQQLVLLDEAESVDICRITRAFISDIRELARNLYLPLLEICKSSLRGLPAQYDISFRSNIHSLVAADKKITLFEWTLQRSLIHHLDANRKPADKKPDRDKLASRVQSARLLLSMLAHAGHSSRGDAERSFAIAMKSVSFPWEILPSSECSLKALDDALAELLHLLPRHKEKLVEACVACVTADGKISLNEAELLRAVTELLGCPLPPMLPTQG